MESTNNSKSRGGARAGAGRKSVDPSEKKVQVSVCLRPDLKARFQEAAKAAGLSTSELLATWVERYA